MSDEAPEFIKKAVEFRESGRSAEAVIAAKRATTLDEADANAWWQLGLALAQEKSENDACSAFEKTVELSPRFAFGWQRLGLCYSKLDMQEEAIESWEHAIELSDERYDSMRHLINAYGRRKDDGDDDKRFELLKHLDQAEQLFDDHINALGIAYYNRKDYHKAIELWKSYALVCNAPLGYFNMGLAYSQKEVGQMLDAVDIWRMAIDFDPEYKSPVAEIERIMPSLIRVGEAVLSRKRTLIQPGQWYENYINPFQLLALDDVDDPDAIDTKIIQKARKSLLQEIELEEGKIDWMPNLTIDRSLAIKIVEDMEDDSLRKHHYMVFENKPLLEFLSKGTLELFIVDPDESPISFLDTLEASSSFASWLSRRFTPQYNLVLGQAVESKCIPEVECLLSGRRWVVSEDDDKCFESSHRSLGRFLEPLRIAREKAKKTKPNPVEIKNILTKDGLTELISKLPIAFQEEKSEAATLIRGISIDAYNVHDDADLAMSILSLSTPFVERMPSLLHQFQEDKDALKERIEETHKDDALLTIKDTPYEITRAGIRFGDLRISIENIEAIRWGVLITHEHGLKKHSFKIVVTGYKTKPAIMEWFSTNNIEEQEKLFNKLVDAAFSYIIPNIIEKIKDELDQGRLLRIGEAPLSKEGVTFTIDGWFGSKTETCPWDRLRADLSNGDLILTDPANRKARITMSLRDTDNSFILYMLAK